MIRFLTILTVLSIGCSSTGDNFDETTHRAEVAAAESLAASNLDVSAYAIERTVEDNTEIFRRRGQIILSRHPETNVYRLYGKSQLFGRVALSAPTAPRIVIQSEITDFTVFIDALGSEEFELSVFQVGTGFIEAFRITQANVEPVSAAEFGDYVAVDQASSVYFESVGESLEAEAGEP